MKRIVINGGAPLFGSFKANGSKNAALPMIFATVACRGVSRISNFPFIGDTQVALDLVSSLGAVIKREGKTVYIDTRELTYRSPDPKLTGSIRASTYLIGACLSRFGRIDLTGFGGCSFAERPIDMHLFAAKALGARLDKDTLLCPELVGARIRLQKPSVGATVNALIMAASARGVTEIYGAAKEPHVLSLIDFLISMGAKIEIFADMIRVFGSTLLSGRGEVIGDMIEAATYLIAGVCTKGEVSAVGIDTESLSSLFNLFDKMGVAVKASSDSVKVCCKGKLRYAKALAKPYPGLPTDLQPLLAPLFALNSGGHIGDLVFPERFGYLKEASSFGLTSYRDSLGYYVFPSKLKAANVKAPDLRGGAACLVCALAARGRSVIDSADVLLRGYESPDLLLRSLGAQITLE